MEQLLHYVWKHRLYPLAPMQTTEGLQVEIIDPGLHNRDSGPDFFNAKVKIDGTLWVGNVEIHDRSSDWYLHGHDHDEHYNNVILHVVGEADRENQRSDHFEQEDTRRGRDDWKQLMQGAPLKLKGEEPDFSEEGWARRKPKKK